MSKYANDTNPELAKWAARSRDLPVQRPAPVRPVGENSGTRKAQPTSEAEMADTIHDDLANEVRFRAGENQWFAFDEEDGWRRKSLDEMATRIGPAMRGLLHRQFKGKLYPDPTGEGRLKFRHAVLNYLSTHKDIRTEPDHWDADLEHLGLPGRGIVHLRSGTVMQGGPENLISCRLGFAPAPFEGTRFARFVEEAFPDRHTRLCAQVLLGSSLHAAAGEYTVIWQGTKRTGKSTLSRAVQDALGDYGGSLDISLIAADKSGSFTRDSMRRRFQGKRSVWMAEPKQGVTLADDAFKALGGGRDAVSARSIGKDEYEFLPTHMLNLTVNDLPYLVSPDPSIFDRVVIVPMNQTRLEGEREELNTLFANDPAEGGAIVSWLLEGYGLWVDHGFVPPSPEMTKSKATWMAGCDPIASYLAEEMQVDAGEHIILKELAANLRTWCVSRGVKLPPYLTTAQRFRRQLEVAGYVVDDCRNMPVLVGYCKPREGKAW